ncbi:hypothetical protein [Nocardia stercoris]|uniref:SWIM-type domain-containing protein n=1 Tax=Nocardia stercoris TaxID=2483361 RepID=A0A3M2KXW5_9NOCA|nr:hypothetical protein [Nocardia stercoris]RMI30091.1 hypothetical protein EBN03_22955 [Nocardia stercoris]
MPDNEFGYTLWGRDWVRLAEPLTATRPEPLLPRARSIARHDGVDLEIQGRHVRAGIHRGGQASVTYLELAPLTPAALCAVAETVTGAVELSDTVYRTVTESGLSLAPRPTVVDCSCSARKDRCLHMLATCYAVARRIDENPWLALDLQGFREDPPPPEANLTAPRWTPLAAIAPDSYFGGAATPVTSAAGRRYAR